MPRLKVFCATSGFHDSIVAAPSRPAALKAWGARTDLFSMGVARQVSDPKIVKRALARPGEVIRLSRSGGDQEAKPVRNPSAKKRPARPPSRAKLAAAEEKFAKLVKTQEAEREELDREMKALEEKRYRLERRHSKARSAAEKKVEDARAQYEAALADWPG